MGWQPIETAPKDGTYFLAFNAALEADSWADEERHMIVQWTGRGYWRIALDGQSAHPTHWMPLPPPPSNRY